MKTITTKSLAEFSQYADVWNYLWSVSGVDNPLSRAESLSTAIKHFHGNDDFQVTFVFDSENEPVAALPLVKRSWRGLFPILELPNNEWGCWGELLSDNRRTNKQVYAALAVAIQDDRYAFLRLPLIDAASRNWKRFMNALQTAGNYVRSTPAFSVGIVEHDQAWCDFQERLSKGFRKKLKKYKRQLNNSGTLSCEILTKFSSNDIAPVMNRVFDVEARSWKADQRTTMRAQGKIEFFTELAQLLAQQEMLCVSFLRSDDRDIAFEFGFLAKRTYHSLKIGFDSRFQDSAPGHILAEFLTERFHEECLCDIQDTVGPISEATARWSSRVKLVENTMISGTIPGSQFALWATHQLKKLVRPGGKQTESTPAMNQPKQRISLPVPVE